MSVVLLDPRFPAMLPVEAVPLLGDDVCYTEEVPVRIRWVIADLGGHTVDETDVLVTTDLDNEVVTGRLEDGDALVKAPSLLMTMEPDREIEAPGGSAGSGEVVADDGYGTQVDYSGGGIVDGEIVGTDDHTAAVAGVRRTSRTEVPSSVMDEIEDAVALMTRAMRQGEWEQSQTHSTLLDYLREETEELAEVIDAAEDESGIDQQELCRELADILLQVLFHAEIANRRGSFDVGHVAGAFVAKLRSRAPYLFEDVERPVGIDEQNRLWAEGRVKEGKPAYKPEPAPVEAADTAGTADTTGESGKHADSAGARVEPHAASFAAVDGSSAADAGTDANADAEGTDGTAPDTDLGADRPLSALAAAEQVIMLARENNLHDSEIPTDIRFPMLGLERDTVGDAEERLIGAVELFRRELDFRFGDAAEAAETTEASDPGVQPTDAAGDPEGDADSWGK